MQIKAGIGKRTRVATSNIFDDGPVVSDLITITSHNIAANSVSLLPELCLGVRRAEKY